MHGMSERIADEGSMLSRLVISLLALSGFALLVLSILLERQGESTLASETIRELGIVLLAVFTVSLIYEQFLARRYNEQFLRNLRLEIEKGESNAAVCAELGIRRIFASRLTYEAQYPIEGLLSGFDSSSSVRIVARSLFLLMGRPRALQTALQQAGTIELCVFDPQGSAEDIASMPDLELSDIQAALARFQKDIVAWIKIARPRGTMRLRFHTATLFDSYLRLDHPRDKFVSWDLSFGRDTTQKRILMLDSNRPLALDVAKRYDHIWDRGRPIFEYDGQEIRLNKLSRVLRGPGAASPKGRGI